MDVIYQRVAGIDISKRDAKVCLRVPSTRPGQYRSEVTTWGATVPQIMDLKAYLEQARVEVAVMESTSDYWKPFFYVLEDTVPVQLANARQARNLPGRKTDVSDAAWLAKMAAYGLLAPSFVPPPPIRELRDLTRARATITRDRSRDLQRLEKFLENTGIKLSSVVSELDGVTSRAILHALVNGERDPAVLAAMARRRLKNKIPQLAAALTGARFDEHAAFMVSLYLDHLETQDGRLQALDERITAAMEPFRPGLDALSTIPGVKEKIAQVIIAETGGDMTAFPSAAQLASWAGVCPGNNESAGRHKPAPARQGDHYLKGALGQAALNVAQQRQGFLAARYRRLVARRGKSRAIVAIEHSIITAVWNMLANGECYQEPPATRYDTAVADRTRQHALKELERLGYKVTITRIQAA